MLRRATRLRADAATRARISVNSITAFTGALGLALIVIASVFIAARERATLFEQAEDHARSGAFFLADHAGRLFEVSDIALHATANAIGDADWDTIAQSRTLWAQMRTTNATLPFVEDLWLNDAAGLLRLTTFAFPAPAADASKRDSFQEVRKGTMDVIVGDLIRGTVTKQPTFLVARRLQWPDGSLRGMVSVTADLAYFSNYWSRLDLADGEHLAVVRESNGVVIARYPEPADPPEGAAETHPFAAALGPAVAANATAGRFVAPGGAPGFYHRIGSLPLFMTVTFDEVAVHEAWRTWLWRFVPFPAAAFIALSCLMALIVRQSRDEARARRAIDLARRELAAANQGLEARVAARTAELSEINDEIQRFAYIVSHDLRAPLVNITGFTSELQRMREALFPASANAGVDSDPGASAGLRADFDEAIGFIQSSIDKMDRLIKAILLLSRGGQRRFQPEPLDMDATMRSIADGVAHRLQTAGATMTIAPLPAIASDRIAIEQVFSNLLDNAVKYLRPGVPGRIAITGSLADGRATFIVSDNGRGIAAKDRTRVFDLFRRAGPQDQPGEGIGLAHVRALVRRLGGTITLDSALGQGSSFTVTLPAAISAKRP